MKSSVNLCIVLSVVLILIMQGCGGSGSVNSINNPNEPGVIITGNQTSKSSGSVLWGLFDVVLDAETSKAEITQLRTAAYEANVTQFLQPPSSPIHLMSIQILPDTNFTTGYVECNITLKHPFPGTKFAGFDVVGIVMGEEGVPTIWDSYLKYGTQNSVRLLNADGWTRWWNQPEFLTKNTIFGYTEGALANKTFNSVTTMNPYKYFADELEPNEPVSAVSATGRGFFSSSSPATNTRKYILQFPANPAPSYRYKYAISANWIDPKPGSSPPYTADEFSIQANKPEAFRITVKDNGSTAYYENMASSGGDIKIILEISDWQFIDGGVPEKEIAAVYVESPTLIPNLINVFDPSMVMPGADPMTVNLPVVIENVTPTGIKDQVLIIHVTSTHPTTYEPQVPGISGFIWPQYAALAAHTIWEVPISPIKPQEEHPPVADASASAPLSGPGPLDVKLDPSNSYDPDGFIVLYEWDYENDGAFDISTTAPDPVNYQFTAFGLHKVNLRVTDNDGLKDTLDKPLEIQVSDPSSQDPIADACATKPAEGLAPLTVNFDPSLSYDPDGTIVKYEWDFENDGTFDTSTTAPSIVSHQYINPGEYQVNLRVTDNSGKTDVLDHPFVVYVFSTAAQWNQLQNYHGHVGSAYNTTVTPPFSLEWTGSFYTNQDTWIGMVEGGPIIGGGYICVLYHTTAGFPDCGNFAVGFNQTTGAKVWTRLIAPIPGTYIGTQTAAYGDGRFYVPGDAIRALDPATGSVIWSYSTSPTETVRAGLNFRDGKVYVMLNVNTYNSSDGDVHILNASNGQLIKKVPVGRWTDNWQPFTMRGNIAYIPHRAYGSANFYVRAWNLDTGQMLWSFLIPDPPPSGTDRSVRGAITVPGDCRVYFGSYNRYYYALDEMTGALIWKHYVHNGNGIAFDTAAYSNGKLYFGTVNASSTTRSRLICLNASTGTQEWFYQDPNQSQYDSWSTCTPLVANGVVYAGCSINDMVAGRIVALNANTGALMWSYTTPGAVRNLAPTLVGGAATDPAIVNNKLYWITDDGKLWCFKK